MLKKIIPLILFAIPALSAEVVVLGLITSLTWQAGTDVRIASWQTIGPDTALKTIAHYKMNDDAASTVVVDSASGGINGTSVRNTSLLATPGKIGGSFLFNGTSDRIDCGRMVQSNATEFSYSAWVYLAGSDPGGGIWNPRGTQLASGFGLTFGCLTAGSYLFVDGPNTLIGRSSPAPTRNVWIHVVGVFTGVSGQDVATANSAIYVDGVKVDSGNVGPIGTKAPPLTPNANTLIGWVTHWAYFGGKLDDVRAYNKALYTSEIRELFNGGNGTEAELTVPREDPYFPIAWFKLDESSASSYNVAASSGLTDGTASAYPSTMTIARGTNAGLSFAGSKNITVADQAPLRFTGAEPFSVTFWYYGKAGGMPSEAVNPALIGKGDANQHNDKGWMVHFYSTSIYFTLNSGASAGANEIQSRSGNIFQTSNPEWHFICISYLGNKQATGVQFFIDGSLSNSFGGYDFNSFTGTCATSDPVILGNNSLNNSQSAGALDDVKIFNFALTAAQAKNVRDGVPIQP